MSFYFKNNFERSFGTWPLKGQVLEQSMLDALKVGYKSFDTAQMYGNEEDIGEIFNKHNINRKQLCITTKVTEKNFSSRLFIQSVEKSLKDLKTDYVDVLLVHWPDKYGDNDEALENLQKSYDKGLAKNIGISNYTISMMKDALKKLSVKPVTNQIEFHPLLDISKIKKFSDEVELPLSAYCSIARGKVFKDKTLIDIGKSFGKSAGQIALKWILQQGVSLNTMSTKFKNINENFDIMDFNLSETNMNKINQCMITGYRVVDENLKPSAPQWD